MSYFTAVIASDGRQWRPRDVDVEDATSLDDLADTLRTVGHGDRPVLALLEHEDEWFALVRVDGDDDPRIFVSDMPAASRGVFAELLAPAAELEAAVRVSSARRSDVAAGWGLGEADTPLGRDVGPGVGPGPDAPEASVDPADDEEDLVDLGDLGDLVDDDPEPPPMWAGDPDLLSDFGVSRDLICELCEEQSDDPAAVLAELGDMVGFGELLEALR